MCKKVHSRMHLFFRLQAGNPSRGEGAVRVSGTHVKSAVSTHFIALNLRWLQSVCVLFSSKYLKNILCINISLAIVLKKLL